MYKYNKTKSRFKSFYFVYFDNSNLSKTLFHAELSHYSLIICLNLKLVYFISLGLLHQIVQAVETLR